MNRGIPCVLMRAGTLCGPFFLRDWLPQDEAARNEALTRAMGAFDLLQVDGLGSGSTLLPAERRIDRTDGVDLDCINAVTPLVIVRARDLRHGDDAPTERAALVGTACKVTQGELHLPA